MNVVALAGGVGGAKLAHGLYQILAPGTLTVIVNTGDDFRHYGLAVSPDLDTVMYTLSGLAHPVNGWGVADDTRQMVDMMKRYGEEGWFGLGDRDLATNILRTHRLAQGVLLSTITAQFAAALGITAALLPMTDQPVATMVETLEHGLLSFQEYFVRYRWQPTVTRLQYAGIENAVAAPGVLAALENADAIIFCPSNPLLSVEPILRIGAIRNAIEKRRTPCLAISPIVAGAALKGPAAKLMGELQLDPSAAGVAAYYGDLIDGFVIDNQDSDLAPALAGRVFVSDIIMRDVADRARLANEVLAWVKELAS